MPEGEKRTPCEAKMKYKEYSKNLVEGFTIYTFFINCNDYVALPMDANVRSPSEESYPYKEMMKTLKHRTKDSVDFFLQNSGISVICKEVRLNQARKEVIFLFPPETGIVNGGHTQLAILNAKKEQDIGQESVRLEVIEGNFSNERLATIAASRNTASNVKPYSTAEKRGLNSRLKLLLDPVFEKHIVWFENRDVPNGKGMDAVDLISRLNLFNVKLYPPGNAQIQPTKSSSSKTSVYKMWLRNQDEFLIVYPLVNDVLKLEEHILSTVHQDVGSTGFTKLKVMINWKENPRKTIFLGKKMYWGIPGQFLLPLLASIRANVFYDKVEGKIGWYEDPEALFDRVKPKLLKSLSDTHRTVHHNEIVQMSRDSNIWYILYEIVNKEVNKNSHWNTYDIPK